MASSIARHTSTISLVSTASLPREGNLFVHTLSRYRDQLETACDKILDKCCLENKSGMAMGQSSQETAHTHSPRVLEGRAREVLAQHLIELLSSLVLPEPLPQTIKDVDARLAEGQLCFPDKLIPTEAELDAFRALAEKGKKASSALLNLPVDKIFIALKELTGRFNHSTCIYITAVTEKVISNFLKMVIYYEESVQVERVIRAATIQNLFHIYRDRVKSQRRHPDSLLTDNFPQDYNKCVDELVAFLSSSLEQMNLILRVFREPILHSACASLDSNSEEAAIQEVFGEALDLYNNFRLLLDYLESDCADESPFSSSDCPASSQQQTLPDSCHSIGSAPPENRRLVGRLLFEPAEDIALASYSSSPERFKSVWRLSERPEVMESLARLSRVIVHTVARLKATSSDVVEPRLVCFHSLCCPSCRLWDQKEFSPLATATTTTKGTMSSACQCNTVVTCFRYLLPRLLLLPIFQFLHFYRLVNVSLWSE
ncbi:unnamed protein product [Mesocestoides corti]|uniref:Uncharacterized protein n=4 Tax=Mesocestoides corti TaxID=53468 RepID=A0A0R3UFC0_MESCO|nr:unnamed protein product [Mesocestoides corti]